MKIVMVINKENRERPIMEKIKNWLLHYHAGCKVSIVSFSQPNYHLELIDFEPDIIFTFPFTAISTSFPFYIAKYILGCHLVCFRTEGVINFDFERQIQGNVGIENYGHNLVDYELFWGDRFASVVGGRLFEQQKVSSLSRIKTLGYPPYEAYLSNHHAPLMPLPAEYREVLANYAKDRVLFFVTGFPLADYTKEDLIRSGDCFDPNGENAEKELQIALNGVKRSAFFRKAWIREITETARKHSDALIVVKSHPVEQIICNDLGIDPYQSFREHNNILYISTSLPISEIMPYCGFFVHYGSTAVAEAYLAGIPSVFVSIDEVYQEKADAETAMFYHNDLGWPSTFKIEIEELQSLIDQHLDTPLKHEQTPLMKQILFEQFNITEDHLSHKQEYIPSQDIALFLLGLRYEAVQKVLLSDQYLHNAIRAVGYSFIEHLTETGLAALKTSNHVKAAECFNKVLILQHVSNYESPQIKCFYATALVACGELALAKQVLSDILSNSSLHLEKRDLLLQLKKITADSLEEHQSSILKILSSYISKNIPEDSAKITMQTERALDPAKPSIFMIESTLACNLRCPECAIGGKLITRQHQVMNFGQFKILADKIKPYAKFLYPYIWGEPTLNPDIIPILRYASSFTKTNISTNGMTMTERLAEDLITSGVSSIIVSIDGYSQDAYGKYRIGGDVNKVLVSLATLQLFNLKHGSGVELVPQFIVFRHNQHEMNEFAQCCRSIGLEPSFKSPYLRDDSLFEYSDFPELVRSHYATEAERLAAMRTCPDAKNTFTVLADGSVVACCYDHNKMMCFGNLFEQEVEEIWENPEYRKFRQNVQSGNAPHYCTNNCLTYYAGSPERNRSNTPST